MIVARYIYRQVTNVTLVATLFLCGAIVLTQSIRFVDLIVNRGISAIEFGYLASLMIPRFLALVMPIALFGSSVFVFQRMIQDGEFVVLRSSGMSTFQLARPPIYLSIVAAAFCYFMTLYLMPVAAQELRENLTEKRSQWGSALLQEGKFTVIGKGATIFVRERDGDEIRGLLYHTKNEGEPEQTILARTGVVIETEDGPRIVVTDGSRQTFTNGTLHLVEFDQTSIAIGVQNEAQSYHWDQPEERFLPRLFNHDESNGDQRYGKSLTAEGHHRIVLPLLPITYTLIGLAFVLRSGFSRGNRGEALLFSFLTVLAVLLIHLWTKSASGKNPNMIFVMYGGAILPALISLFLISRPGSGGLSGNKMKKTTPNQELATEV